MSVVAISSFVYVVLNSFHKDDFSLLIKEYKGWSIPGIIEIIYGSVEAGEFYRQEALYFEIPAYLIMLGLFIMRLKHIAPRQYDVLKQSFLFYVIILVPIIFQTGGIFLFYMR